MIASVTAEALVPSTMMGGKFKESINELVVGSTYEENVLGIALVLTRNVL